jgi:oligosaccharide repeat unit polymerase
MFFVGPNMDPDLSTLINYDIYFFSSVLVGFFGLYLGLHLLPHYRKRRNQNFPDPSSGKGKLGFIKLIVPIILFLIPILMIVRGELANSGLTLVDYFKGGRLDDYLNSLDQGKSTNAFWYILVSSTRPVLLLLICYLWDSKRHLAGWIVYLFTLLGILLIFKTRLELLITILVPIAYYHYRVRKLKFRIVLLIIPIALIGLIAMDYWRNMGVEEFTIDKISSESITQGFSRDINAVRGFEKIWQLEKADRLDHEYGLNYLYILLTPIPRALWQDKPFTAFEPRWTAKLFNDFKEGVWIFTAWGEGMAQFGFFGIFLNLILYGLVVKLAMIIFNKPDNSSILVWFYYSVLAASFLRAGFQQVFVLTIYYFLFYYLYRRLVRI